MLRGIFKQTILVALILGVSAVQAQNFDNKDVNSQTPSVANVQLPEDVAAQIKSVKKSPQITEERPITRDELFMPKDVRQILERPTLDGVERGHMSINRVDNKGRKVDPSQDKAQIFLYYENFQVDRTITGRVTCSVRFIINTNLDSKLISLAVKLVWPEISTNLSFINVLPNTPTYFDYTLMGNGCYSMDKFPNIVVNRCRIKGISANDCAAKITWLKDAK